MNERAGWEQQEECERARWEMLMDALDAACEGKATPEQMKMIARECGVTNYQPRGTHEPIQPH